MTMLIYFLLIIAIPILIQLYLRRTYAEHLRIAARSGLTGREVARRLLDANGLYDVRVEEVRGKLTDHYDPTTKTVRLSSDNYYGSSIASVSVAAHEVGHAIQDAEGYAFLRFRHALVPLATFGSNASFFFILLGIVLYSANLILLGIITMAFAVLFQIVTLPVEFNASSRALNQMVSLNVIGMNEEHAARKVLNAAALTYVAATVVAVLELVRFIMVYAGMNNE
ncbi:peptidase membrane zinc metallopeptidase [Caldalkalibacillus thermarum TA2.A1]|uniref:Zinc metallopeptidase n=1 Tax=Caldalkalibacillus thermarum (strain TA2.A1) TaxID=986075 RepID=F5L8X1_CALTT|nr:zinc metallopeptidase [Caldalkalibacillus thermarum]EGL82253.1 peptidase membrane zinc metallopeptidase [Caldalkalibacillus thermarum TA2.A1]QZT32733.1 zinc metallopeptidase [Caldalkalibacillus thermarum TA2.A1]